VNRIWGGTNVTRQLDLPLNQIKLPELDSAWLIYCIKCVVPKRYYVGICEGNDPWPRFEVHRAGRGSIFTHEFGAETIVFTWPANTQREALRLENYYRVEVCRTAGPGSIVSNGVISRNINGRIVTGREETTLGHHEPLPMPKVATWDDVRYETNRILGIREPGEEG